jgi:A/G-specific adenine glycosylase
MAKDKEITEKTLEKSLSDSFTKGLLQWNKTQNRREMPWKGEKDPYKIWLSEIILQQTRVEQGLSYYERFIKTYPTIKDLANAPEQQVFKLWEGLGYYSRCKNLIAAAKHIASELKGIFPQTFETILSLKGVGSYTASAIASFAYNQPYAVLDGNVFRVLSRIFNIESPTDTTEGKKLFSYAAQKILPLKRAGEYNQAIMDFGATICKPMPECSSCFFNTHCHAFLEGKQLLLPVKSKRLIIKERWFNYILIRNKNKYAIRQRTGKDIWQNLFEFVLIEENKKLTPKQVLSAFQKKYGVEENSYKTAKDIHLFKQRLSHQLIHFQFIIVELQKKVPFPEEIIWVAPSELSSYPFPKTLQQYIKSHF